MLESAFQRDLIKQLEREFPGCYVIKNDPTYRQGFPDLLVLYKDRWIALEVKASETSTVQPNQYYYVEQLNDMSGAWFIYPENKRRVLNEIRKAFSA